jgi:nucleotide-binding universal stress UspA family protein
MKLQTILVPLDGSTLAEGALGRAAELAGDTGARLLLLRAVEASALLGTDRVDAEVRLVRDAEEYLAAVSARARAMGARNVATSVWYGAPAWAIPEAARAYGADLIVMTTHGRSGLGRLILGSVAEQVLRATTAPILLLRDVRAPVATKPPEVPVPTPAGSGPSASP